MALSIGELVGYVTLNTAGVEAGAAKTAATMSAMGKGMDRAGIAAANGWVQGADGKLRDAQGKFVSAGEQAAAGLGQGVQKKSGMLSSAWAKAVGAIAIGSAIKASVGLEAAYSKTMAQIGAVVQGAGGHMDQMDKLAMKLGADTQYSAGQAAGAMLELGKAGINASDIMGGALKGTLTLAAAGSTDLGTAATIASNAMNTFGLHGKDMGTIAAALAGGANASSASVESLGQALQQVGPGATNAGLSLNETVAALSAFDAAGIKGSDAGTSLKTMLANLIPQSKRAAQAMEQYGLYQYDATNASKMMAELGLKPLSNSYNDVRDAMSKYLVQQGVAKEGSAALATAVDKALISGEAMHSSFVNSNGTFKDMTQIAGILQKKLGGLSESQRTQALTQIFGSDASRAATVLMKEGAAGMQGYIKATKDKTAADKMAAANMSGTSGALERMRGSIETAGLAFGKLLQPATLAVAASVGGMAAVLASAAGFLADNHGAAITLVAVLGALTAVTLAHNAAMAVGAAGGMAQWLTQTRAISAVTKVWTAIQWAFNAAMSANPLALVVIGLAALAGALILAWNKSETFRGIVTGAMDAVRGAAAAVWGWFKSNWPLLLTILTGPIGIAARTIMGHWTDIKSGASSVVEWIKGIPAKIGALGSSFGKAGKDLLGAFIDGMKHAAGIIEGIAGNVWDTVKGLLNGAIDKINAALEFKISLPGKDLSINPPDIPKLATGGRGRANSPMLATVFDANEPESVLRDSQLSALMRAAAANAVAAAGGQQSGRGGPLIDKVVQQPGESADELAERLWFLTRTRG